MYVNIYYEASDCHLSDYDLLQGMLLCLEEHEASLTHDPEDEEIENCFSFRVPGSTQSQVYLNAINRVLSWIRHVDTRGLPFHREDVFQSGLGLNFMAPQ
ncbi:uncharacterized protein N7496_008844 [Penicillium cataractarum]|uniref:Uncharacterized protein n=1 Tax=Penicillium cataractarum TaxID=2100454 RepID=A0A9W9V639_9EURO|nr:uncharacterized protein N7496_008844 [Penicillium cataractarum]KAJ5369084.1 hypothetical protein N7496_008844 [Penicillium cataractarum]